jgi:hypothetical protein
MALPLKVTVDKLSAYFGNVFPKDEELISNWIEENRYIDLWLEADRGGTYYESSANRKSPPDRRASPFPNLNLCSD